MGHEQAGQSATLQDTGMDSIWVGQGGGWRERERERESAIVPHFSASHETIKKKIEPWFYIAIAKDLVRNTFMRNMELLFLFTCTIYI